MTRTAYDEFYGVGLDRSISTNYVLRLQYGENGANFYLLRPSVAALDVRLPVAGWARYNDKITIANHGSHTLTVKDVIGTTIATITVGNRSTFILVDVTVVQGVWLVKTTASTAAAALVHERTSLSLIFGTWGGNGINLREYAQQAFGFPSTNAPPASIYCKLRGSIVIGSETTTQPAFDTGLWTAGSSLLLEIEAGSKIVGIGGRGGNGQNLPLATNPQNGSVGGDALVLRISTGLVNYGVISSGGGGGGGGNASVSVAGGGGGGGAGYQPSLGGNGGTGIVPGTTGGYGMIDVGGFGASGGYSGGNGGGPGAAGSNGLGFAPGTGAQPGKSITTHPGVILNKIVAGTINGPELTL